MIVESLTDTYLNKENWHKNKLSKEQSDEYHERLLVQGNILTYIKDGELVGYLEFWRINTEQLGRIVCGIPVYTDEEDILSGNISFINNMWINPDNRHSNVFEVLACMFLSRNKDSEYFVAMRRLKHSHPIQVYRRDELIKLYTRGV